MGDARTARCGAFSSKIFLCLRCLFAYRYCLWLIVARIANSSPHPLLRNKHPAAILAIINFLFLFGLVMFARITSFNCQSAARICTVARSPVNCRISITAPTTELGRCRCRPVLPCESLPLEGGQGTAKTAMSELGRRRSCPPLARKSLPLERG